MTTYTRADLIKIASRLITEAGGQSAAARKLDISRQSVHQVVHLDPDVTEYDGLIIRIVEGLGGVEIRKTTRFESVP